MNKQDKIKKLTWKYFWQQKWEEIYGLTEKLFLLYLPAGFIFGMVMILGIDSNGNFNGEFRDTWKSYIVISLWAIQVIGLLIYVFIWWIKDNWKRAKKRATKEAGK